MSLRRAGVTGLSFEGRGDIKRVFQRYALQSYGNLISTEEPSYDTHTSTWQATLKSDYPLIIQDDRRPSERMVKFLSMKSLGVIHLTKDLAFRRTSSPRDACVQAIINYLKTWQERAERIVVKASSKQLIKVSGVRHFLHPIDVITVNLLDKDVISDQDIELYERTENIRKYFKLLEGLELVERTEEGYTYGNLFATIRQKSPNAYEFRNTILSHVIEERYSTLRDVYGITRLEPSIHVDNCYYRTALEAEEIIYRTKESIFRDYIEFYGRISPLKLEYTLNELVEAEALHQEGKYYYANKDIFPTMLAIKSGLPELGPPTI